MTSGRPRKKLVEIALQTGFLDMGRLLQAQKLTQETGLRLASVLLRYRFASPDRLARLLSSSLGIDILDRPSIRPSPMALKLVPEEACRKLRVLPLGLAKRPDGELVNLAMIDPTDVSILHFLEERLGRKVRPLLVDDAALEDALNEAFPPERPPAMAAPAARTRAVPVEERHRTPPREEAPPAQAAPPPPTSAQVEIPPDDHIIDLKSVVDGEPFVDELPPSMPGRRPGRRVCFVSTDQVLRMIVDEHLSPLVAKLIAADDIDAAFGLAHKGVVDAVVLCEPSADVATRSLVSQLSKMAKARVVVVSTVKAWRTTQDAHAIIDPPENLLSLPAAIVAAIEA